MDFATIRATLGELADIVRASASYYQVSVAARQRYFPGLKGDLPALTPKTFLVLRALRRATPSEFGHETVNRVLKRELDMEPREYGEDVRALEAAGLLIIFQRHGYGYWVDKSRHLEEDDE
jgi:hypothetical protein